MDTTPVRVPEDLVASIDEQAERAGMNRSTVFRQAIERGLRDLAIERALDRYQRGGVTTLRASKEAGISLWTFQGGLERRGAWFRTDDHELRAQLLEAGREENP